MLCPFCSAAAPELLDMAFTAGSMTSLKITSNKVLMVSGVFGEGAKEQQHSGCDRRTALPCGLRKALTVPAAGKPLGKTCVSLPEHCSCPIPAEVTHLWEKGLRDGDGE